MRKYAAIASRYVWLILILMLLGGTRCTSVSSQSDETQVVSPALKTSEVEGWTSLDRQVRDVQILESLVLLNNSAPPWGQGAEDDVPFIMAFSPDTQKIVWELQRTSTTPIVANSQNFFIVEESQLVAIDLSSGDETWRVPFTDSGLSQVFCDDDLVLAANREALFAFNATNGELHWKSDLPVPLDTFVPLATSFTSWREHNALTEHNHTVYARRVDYHNADECRFSLFALDATSGSERWRFPIQQSNQGECLPGTLPLVFGDGLVLVGTWDNPSGGCVLNALNEDSGEVVWSHQITESCSTSTQSTFLDGKFVLISAKNVLALEAHSGHLLWRRECLPGGVHQLLTNQGWIICRSEGTTEKTHSLIDLYSGRVIDKLDVSPPEACDSVDSLAGLSNNQIVLVVGNCIRSFNVNVDDYLKP